MVGSTYIFDLLDNPLRPTSGFRFQGDSEVAGLGGDVFYASGELAGYYFYPLLEGFTLKLKGTAGHMLPWAGEEVPILDRFYKGGDSFRGFARSGIGPRMERSSSSGSFSDELDAIGGQTYAVGTVEFFFPVGLPEEYGVSGSVFSDFGTLFNAPEKTVDAPPGEDCGGDGKCKVFDTSELRASVGAGITWESPFGPLRFDVAYPFLKADYDEVEYFRFGIGTKF
jgi:outer membrane protein insertion porin family